MKKLFVLVALSAMSSFAFAANDNAGTKNAKRRRSPALSATRSVEQPIMMQTASRNAQKPAKRW